MEPIPPAIKDDNYPIELTPTEVEVGFKHLVITMPMTYSYPSGTIPQTIISAKIVESGVLLVKMRDLIFGGDGYGLFIFGRDPTLLNKNFIKPEWNQSWDGLASSLEAAALRLRRPNMGLAIPIHRDSPPPERVATQEELQ